MSSDTGETVLLCFVQYIHLPVGRGLNLNQCAILHNNKCVPPTLQRRLQNLKDLQGRLDAAVEIGVCEAVPPTHQQRLREQCHLPRAISHRSGHLITEQQN